MSTAEDHHVRETTSERLAQNEALLHRHRVRRVRREAALRQADRSFRAGLALIRRATLRVVSPS